MTNVPSPPRPVPIPESRAARAAQMGTMAARVAGRMAWDGLRQISTGDRPRARDLLLTPANMRRIADDLARMRGAAMKLGQLISMDGGDMLPPELSDIMARLRAQADFMPPKQLRQVLDTEWGAAWRQHFATFDVRPIAAASIGQVHKARLKSGETLAIKVQYPGVARSIDSDITNVGRLLRLSGLLPPGFDLEPYLDEARKQLLDEADYQREARYLTAFYDILSTAPDFTVPRPHLALTTERILAMGFVTGTAIEGLATAQQSVRDRVMRQLFDLFLREVFTLNLVQTDPNFANFQYNDATGAVVLLDFGATRDVTPALADLFLTILRLGLAQDRAAMSAHLADHHILPADMDGPLREALIDMIFMVFDEILSQDTLDFGTTTLNKRLSAAGEAMAARNVAPPPVPMDLLFVQRKIAGLFLLATRLRARVDVQSLLRAYLS